jgi:hypothetical protein
MVSCVQAVRGSCDVGAPRVGLVHPPVLTADATELTDTLVLPSGVAARGNRQLAERAAARLARRPQPVPDADMTKLAVTCTPASAATLRSLNART